MSKAEQKRIRRGDAIRQTSDDYDTDAQAEVAAAIIDRWGEGASVSDIADEAGRSGSFTRRVLNTYFQPIEEGESPEDQRVRPIDAGIEVDESRVALLADWYGVGEKRARTLAHIEAESDIELAGTSEDPEKVPPSDPEPPAEPQEERPPVPGQTTDPNVPATQEAMAAYRAGFRDGFETALEVEG